MDNPNNNSNNNNQTSHSHYRTTGTRRIPSWLNAIPSEAGAGSDATSRTGPASTIASHHHHHHQQGPPPPYSLGQPSQQQQPEKSGYSTQDQSMSPPKMKIRGHFNPPNQQLYSETSLASSDQQNHQFGNQTPPKPTTSTQPTSTQQSSQQVLSQQGKPASPSKSGNVLDPLRQEIIGNFTAQCVACIFSASGATSPLSQCGRCSMIKSYVNQTYHTYRFLHSFLLPISEVFNYEEMLAYLNEAIIERVMSKGEQGKEKVYPVMDDFGVVVNKAKRRKEFFGGGVDRGEGRGVNGRVIGQWGMVRDGTVNVPREEGGSQRERKRGWNEEGRVIY
ncbi:hypothetical protein QBC41DRAFT_123 [Cercophora samala]|uniref:Uncharacterized protein n=1 Tax=Cercophora samala TaxID=330535 RepID=A0AA39ZNM7_9PEZI|nr:hypothetical protein QBC41DRAFT_123 [Cercophora samala]